MSHKGENQYALVTGASQGLGKWIAVELAKRGYGLVLVSRSMTTLNLLKAELERQYTLHVIVLEADLSDPQSPEKIRHFCERSEISLSVLVNNAGFGLWGNFKDLPLLEQEAMMCVNTGALIALTYQLLPLLQQNDAAYILNVSSTAAYQAVPCLAVYAASKAYVLSFSRALHYELKEKGIGVTCACPGPMETGFMERAGMQALAALGQKYNMQPKRVAQEAIKAMFQKKIEVVPGVANRLQRVGTKWVPRWIVERIAFKLYKK